MASILSTMNKKIETALGEEYMRAGGRKADEGDVLKKYKSLKEKGTVIKLAFSTVGKDATFTTVEGDVTIVLPGSKYMEFGKSESTYATANLLGREFQVRIYDIDSVAKKVYVELAGGMKESYLTNIRDEIASEFNRLLSRGEHPIVWGRINSVNRDKILVDILDKGILGFLSKSHWSKDYVRSMENVCREGEYCQFEVIGKAPKVAGKSAAWVLSRKKIAPSAWDSVDVDGLQEDGVLLVTCVEKPADKTYWWGCTERLPGIELMGDYTNRFTEMSELYVGIKYKCKIKYIDKGARRICVIPFDVAPADVPKVESLKNAQKSSGAGV